MITMILQAYYFITITIIIIIISIFISYFKLLHKLFHPNLNTQVFTKSTAHVYLHESTILNTSTQID